MWAVHESLSLADSSLETLFVWLRSIAEMALTR